MDDDTIQLGGIKGLKTLKLYYIYLPLIIGLITVGVGFMIDFVLFETCGAVFLLYSVYGAIVVQRKVANNKNIKIIKNGELEVTQDATITTLTSDTIKDIKINIEMVTKETYEGQITISGVDNTEYFILSLFNTEKRLLGEDLDYIKKYIQLKLNSAKK